MRHDRAHRPIGHRGPPGAEGLRPGYTPRRSRTNGARLVNLHLNGVAPSPCRSSSKSSHIVPSCRAASGASTPRKGTLLGSKRRQSGIGLRRYTAAGSASVQLRMMRSRSAAFSASCCAEAVAWSGGEYASTHFLLGPRSVPAGSRLAFSARAQSSLAWAPYRPVMWRSARSCSRLTKVHTRGAWPLPVVVE